tara:strand:- start:1095 stop:1508 length:414 start_codon:yes stop_codon:yes gene_type:complete
MGQILGLDYGKKRCGISITDELQLIASPLSTIKTNELIDFLSEIISKNKISILVIGQPKKNDNTFFDLENSIISEIKKIKTIFPKLKIEREDERFTSKLSRIYINDFTNKKKIKFDKKNLDKISASLILESYLKRNK